MPKILHTDITVPIEREYEAWITRRIREYYRSIGVKIELFAINPDSETIFPADHILYTNGKLVGLQFKKANMSKRTSVTEDFSQLKWTFGQPAGQFELVQKIKEIYYVLPTFISRDYEDSSLHHCLFWRPQAVNYNAWYCNESAQTETPYNSLQASMRWGHFYECLVKCTIGIKIYSRGELDVFVSKLKDESKKSAVEKKESRATSNEKAASDDTGGLYLLLLENK